MNKETSACKSAANFSAEETDMLIDLIKKKKHVIESKTTDCVLLKEKDTVWDGIAKDFNAHSKSNVYRSAVVLRSYFDNATTEDMENADNKEAIIMHSNPSTSTGQCCSNITIEKWTLLADAKKDLLHIQQIFMEEEHQGKMHLLQEQKKLILLQIEEQKLKNELVKLDLFIKQNQ